MTLCYYGEKLKVVDYTYSYLLLNNKKNKPRSEHTLRMLIFSWKCMQS